MDRFDSSRHAVRRLVAEARASVRQRQEIPGWLLALSATVLYLLFMAVLALLRD